MVKKFSQKFVVYHGCGAWYHDGTNKIVHKRKCIYPTYEPFWKRPNDVRNRVETRLQLKLILIVTNVKRYFRYIDMLDENKKYFSSDDDSTGNQSIIADNESKTDNAISNTGEDLIIDENSASNEMTQSETLSSTQNPDN